MKRILLASCVATLGLPGLAQAATQVYPGCAAPSLKAGYHTFYVDPVKGSSAGDGSAAKPWKTLAEVLDPNGKLLSTRGHKKVGGTDDLSAVNPTGPIKAGDVIMLMSGNHGAVKIQNAFNADFITVMAAPGQTPLISQMTVMSAAKWMFQGIKFQGQDPSPAPATIGARSNLDLVSLGRNEWQGASSDFVFTNDSFSTTDDPSKWSPSDWLLKPYLLALNVKSAPCTTVTSSRFYNVLNGFYHGSPNVLVQNNVFEFYANDAIETAASNTTIKSNTIRKNMSPSAINPWHPDGIQGWSVIKAGVSIENKNVMIDGNTIIKTGDPNQTWMQGISIFDGIWTDLTIQNNVVVTNHWHGIAVYGAKKLRILNNTVLASAPDQNRTWIRVDPAKDGTPSQDVVVRNNISTNLLINNPNVVYDHNAVVKTYLAVVSGKAVTLTKPDTALQIAINPSLLSQFVKFDNSTATYDLRLGSASPFVGAGSTALAPAFDITGKKRTAAVDLGAYAK